MKGAQLPSEKSLTLLSRLLLRPTDSDSRSHSFNQHDLATEIAALDRSGIDDLLTLASSHHVIVRGLEAISELHAKRDLPCPEWVSSALARERARIGTAMVFLTEISSRFEQRSIEVAVIKSLDHWPDIGSDLDLFTNARPAEVIGIMTRNFGATIAPRSWGDRLAQKWNFVVPGLGEAIEIHVGRLGQTGEHVAFPGALLKNAHWTYIGGSNFLIASTVDRILISTLQRMYRHFYFRLCDIVDTIALGDAGRLDYEELYASAKSAGIWEGVATYLTIVSDYATTYRGFGLDLPQFVFASTCMRESEVFYGKGFLRVPILPTGARLYGSQLAGTMRRREFRSSARLSIFPWLATAALVGERMTGSDKGIW